MKIRQWVALLSVFSLLGTAHAADYYQEGGGGVASYLPCGSWSGHIDYLYWKTRKCGLDYLWPADITRWDTICDGTPSTETPTKIEGDVVTLGRGSPKEIDLGHDDGFRFGIYNDCGCWDFGVQYTHYRSGETDSFDVKETPYTPSRQHPDIKGFVDRTNILSGKSSFDLDLDIVDVVGQYSWDLNNCSNLVFLGGFKYASINQEVRTSYRGLSLPKEEQVDVRIHRVREQNDMDAYGLFIGIEGTWNLMSCVTLFARTSCGSLLGNFERSFTEKEYADPETCQSPLFPVQQLVDVHDSPWCNVQHFEYAIGADLLACQGPCGDWHFQVGYESHTWSDMRGFIQFTDHHAKGGIIRASDNLGFDGLFLRLVAHY